MLEEADGCGSQYWCLIARGEFKLKIIIDYISPKIYLIAKGVFTNYVSSRGVGRNLYIRLRKCCVAWESGQPGLFDATDGGLRV